MTIYVVRPPQGLIFIKFIKLVSLVQSHHKPIVMYDGSPLRDHPIICTVFQSFHRKDLGGWVGRRKVSERISVDEKSFISKSHFEFKLMMNGPQRTACLAKG